MKKRVILFLTVTVFAACLFTLCISADGIYSDYTENGVNGENPIFTFNGYSIDPESKSICVEYSVDLDALENFEEKSGETLKYGVVAAYKGYVVNSCPLNSKTAKPTGSNADKIVVHTLSEKRTPIISIRVIGLEPSQFTEELVLCLYTFDKNGVKYISDINSTDTADDVTYSEIRGPLEVTVNGVTYSTGKETNTADDRDKQMASSASAYKSTPNANVSGAEAKANMVVVGGYLGGYTQARTFLQYYLSGKGGTYNLDVANFLNTDSGAMNSRNSALSNALRASERLAQSGEVLAIINQTEENHPMQGTLAEKDWQYTVGSYFTDVDIINLTVTEENGVKTYSASFKYIVIDFYNWNAYDDTPFLGLPGWISPSPKELYSLHTKGSAQEFLTYGEITYENVTWTEGQTVSEITAFN